MIDKRSLPGPETSFKQIDASENHKPRASELQKRTNHSQTTTGIRVPDECLSTLEDSHIRFVYVHQ